MTISPSRLRWYAVRCHSARVVTKAAAEISRLGVPTFVPKSYRQERQGRWLVSVEDGLLFPPYLFIKKRPPGTWKSRSSMVWGALLDVDGVAQVMGYHRNDGELVPVAIPYDVMRPLLAGEETAQHRREANRPKKDTRYNIVCTLTSDGWVGLTPRGGRARVWLENKGVRRATWFNIFANYYATKEEFEWLQELPGCPDLEHIQTPKWLERLFGMKSVA